MTVRGANRVSAVHCAVMTGIMSAQRRRNAGVIIALALLATVSTGCSSTTGPRVVSIDASAYDEAFRAALDASDEAGFRPMLRDRRAGVIETDHVIAGSILEPWRADESSFADSLANTVNLQRRRIRFEFTPVAFDPESASEGDEDALVGPDLLAIDRPRRDLTRHEGGPIEIRAWVWVERAYNPGRRRFAWSRRATTSTRIIDPETGERISANHWTPVSRDVAFERFILREIQSRLESAS